MGHQQVIEGAGAMPTARVAVDDKSRPEIRAILGVFLTNRPQWAFLATATAFFIFVQSNRSAPSVGDSLIDEIAHVVAHFTMFGFLAFCLARATGVRGVSALVLVATASFVYGISDEIHQAFVPSRRATAEDLLVDCLGAIAGSGLSQMVDVCRAGALDDPTSPVET